MRITKCNQLSIIKIIFGVIISLFSVQIAFDADADEISPDVIYTIVSQSIDKYDDEIVVYGDVVNIVNSYGNDMVEKGDSWAFALFVDELKNTTEEFRKCIDNGNYNGIIEISSTLDVYDGHGDVYVFVLNNKATCKRK